MCALATLCSLETAEVDWGRAFRWTGGITAAIALAVGLMPKTMDADGNFTEFGLENYPHRFWGYVAVAFVSLLLCYLLIPIVRRNQRKFARYATLGVMLISVLYSIYFIALGKTQSYDTHNYVITYCLNKGKDFRISHWLINELGVVAIPPTEFYIKEHEKAAENLLRFAVCKDDAYLENAVERLKLLKDYL